MAELSWQQKLASETDAAKKEWMAVERRYYAELMSKEDTTQNKRVRLFVSLSDPELPARLKGQVELQLTLPGEYPVEAAHVDFDQWGSRLSEEQVGALNTAVNARAEELCGGYALRNLLTWIDNNFWRIIESFEKEMEEEQELDEGQEVTTESSDQTTENGAQVEELTTPVEEVTCTIEKKSKRRRGRRPCRFFARGKCKDGENCKFSHVKKQDKAEEGSGEETSDADAASVVREADPAQATEVSAPAPEPKKKKKTRVRKCKFFAQNKCRDGDKCKFSHELKSAGAANKGQNDDADILPRVVVVQMGSPIRSTLATEDKSPNISVVTVSTATNEPKVEHLLDQHGEDSSKWSEAQQRALDLALKKYPPSMDKKERWTSIASEVEGRSLNECIDRFKMLCELMRRGVDPTIAAATDKSKSEEEVVESAESEDHGQNAKITPPEKRVAIETEPEAKGTQISLEDLFLHEVGTLVAHRLVCQVLCDNCPLKFDAILTLDATEIQKWCPRCSVLHHVLMRPVFAHSQSNVLAYVDTQNCSIVDVLPTDMLATCLECGCEALLEKITPRQRSEQACFACHVKLAVMAKRLVAGQLECSISKRSVSPDGTAAKTTKSKKGGKQVAETIVLGQPLPRNGICDHYKHSLRWFRFQCCGKVFPCDVCHDSSDCPEANLGKFAGRMICGLCSKEQSSSVKVCSCGNDVASKKSSSRHWEGGAGCRDSSQMSRWDKQKHRGQNKTESKKFKRVGAEAKKRREKANGNVDAQQ